MKKSSRSKLEFKFKEPIIPIIKEWANRNGFRVEIENEIIKCEKPIGLMSAPVHVYLEDKKGFITLEAFLKIDPITMFSTLFMAPDEFHLESGGDLLVLERKRGRIYVNKLLEKFNLPLLT